MSGLFYREIVLLRRLAASIPSTGPVYPATSVVPLHDRHNRHVAHPPLHPLTGSPVAERTPTIQMPVVGLEAWFTQIPPVTRTWLALSVLTSVAVVRPPPLPVDLWQQDLNIIITRMMLLILIPLSSYFLSPLGPWSWSHVAMSIGNAITALLQL
jgi:hypothetical protein